MDFMVISTDIQSTELKQIGEQVANEAILYGTATVLLKLGT